ncbi:MAG: hypothetical protein P1V97_02845 [Planctomycetota bacterium]|nr:hypothetical protein [Planctomycetota bacterium]
MNTSAPKLESKAEAEESSPPFALLIIFCFLTIDSLERAYEAIDFLLHSEAPMWRAIVFGLWIATNVLLILLLYLKTFAGRLWTMVVFGIHLFYLGFHIVSENKLLWLSLGEWGQSRVLLTMAIDAWILHLVSRQEVKDYLIE